MAPVIYNKKLIIVVLQYKNNIQIFIFKSKLRVPVINAFLRNVKLSIKYTSTSLPHHITNYR